MTVELLFSVLVLQIFFACSSSPSLTITAIWVTCIVSLRLFSLLDKDHYGQ